MDIDKMIEAGALAISERITADMRERIPRMNVGWHAAARACLTAALAEARSQGAVLAVVPGEKTRADQQIGDDWGYEPLGWNAAIAAVIAAEVGL